MQTPARMQISTQNTNPMPILLSNQSPLNAIAEHEEEDLTQTIPNSSPRKKKNSVKLIELIPNNNQTQQQQQQPQVMKNIQFNSSLLPNSTKESSSPKAPELPSLIKIPIQCINPSKTSSNFLDETRGQETSKDPLNIQIKDNGIIYPINMIYKDGTIQNISYREVFNLYSSIYMVRENHVPVVKSIRKGANFCCLRQLLFKYVSKYLLDNELQFDREVILFIADIEFDISNEMHWNMMVTIYWGLYDSFGEKAPMKIGKEWEKLFDSQTPLFPIEKGGLYAMTQLLYIVEKYSKFVKELMVLFNNDEMQRNFTIECLCSITLICIEFIENNELNVYFNKKKNIIETLCEFYLGFIYQLKNDLDKNMTGPFTLETLHGVIKNIKDSTTNTPSSILWKCMQFKEIYIEENDKMYLSKSCADA